MGPVLSDHYHFLKMDAHLYAQLWNEATDRRFDRVDIPNGNLHAGFTSEMRPSRGNGWPQTVNPDAHGMGGFVTPFLKARLADHLASDGVWIRTVYPRLHGGDRSSQRTEYYVEHLLDCRGRFWLSFP